MAGGFGHAAALSPDETRLSTITENAVDVTALDLTGSRYAELADDTYVLDVEWIDDSHIVVLVTSPAGSAALHRFEVTDVSLVAAGSLSIPKSTALAGVHDGVLYVSGGRPTLTAYAGDTLAPLPSMDIEMPLVPLSAAMHDGELRWIDYDRALHIGDTIVPGQYVWVG